MKIKAIIISLLLANVGYAQTAIYVNQVAFNSNGPKQALVCVDKAIEGRSGFSVINALNKNVYHGKLGTLQQVED